MQSYNNYLESAYIFQEMILRNSSFYFAVKICRIWDASRQFQASLITPDFQHILEFSGLNDKILDKTTS